MWLVVLGLGCMPDVESAPFVTDEGAPGASVTSTHDAPRVIGTIAVQVIRHGEPLPDRLVFANRANGEAVGETRTDARGFAHVPAFEGGLVSVFVDDESSNWYGFPEAHVDSVYGAHPGDVVTFGTADPVADPADDPSPGGGPILELRAPGPVDGAASLYAWLGCDRTAIDPVSLTETLEVRPTCRPQTDALFVAYGAGGESLAVAGVTAIDTTSDQPIEVAPAAWDPFVSLVDVTLRPPDDNGWFTALEVDAIRNGARFPLGGTRRYPGDPAWLDVPIPWPGGFAESYRVSYDVVHHGSARRWETTWTDPPAVLDASSLRLPPPVQATVTGGPDPVVQVALTDEHAAEATSMEIELSWGGGYLYETLYAWTITMETPRSVQLAVPRLPPSLARFEPGPLPVSAGNAQSDVTVESVPRPGERARSWRQLVEPAP